MEYKKTYKILTIILVMQWAFIQILAQNSSLVEKYYSNGLYVFISKLLRILFGWIPISIGDILYAIIVIFIVRNIYIAIKNKKFQLKNTLFKIGGFISVLFFFFNFNWGLNYLRQPLFKTLNLKKNTYTQNELIDFTKALINKTNQVQISITKNDTIAVENSQNKEQIKEGATLAYEQLQKIYPNFNGKNISVKHSLFSIPLTYMGFAGYLNPFTNESQVNSLIPKNSYPATVCHELAHQVGIAKESEANFVGYLAAIHSKDAYFEYSGYSLALNYCLFEIFTKEPEQFEILQKELNKGILKDLQQRQDFWKSYQNWSEKYFKNFYDTYLKANKQKEGINEYNKMVSLLINYYKTQEL